MDIGKLDSIIAADEEVADVTITQKSGEPYLAADGTPATIGVVGSESKQYRLGRDKITRKLTRMGRVRFEPEDIRKNRVEQAAAAVVRWHGWEMNGKDWPCTPENVKLLLAYDHILEQVEYAIASHADFFGKPSGS